MELSRKQRWQRLQSVFEPGLGRMLLVSVLIHLLLPVLYFSPLFPKGEPSKPPVYRVNLVNKPVKNPQAGRPEATPVKKPRKKPKPISSKPKPVLPKPQPKPVSVAKPTPKVEPTLSKSAETALQQRLEQLRAKQEQKKAEQERKDRLAALRAAVARETEPIDAPPGMLDGKGTEVGVDEKEYVREFITRQWRLSPYQTSRSLEAEVLMVYGADGRLIHYKFLENSGNEIFDESLRRAILKSKDLGQPLPSRADFQVVFNLKEMLD